jgi:hypothetical protein
MFARPLRQGLSDLVGSTRGHSSGSHGAAIIDEILTELGDDSLHTEYCLDGTRRILPGLRARIVITRSNEINCNGMEMSGTFPFDCGCILVTQINIVDS